MHEIQSLMSKTSSLLGRVNLSWFTHQTLFKFLMFSAKTSTQAEEHLPHFHLYNQCGIKFQRVKLPSNEKPSQLSVLVDSTHPGGKVVPFSLFGWRSFTLNINCHFARFLDSTNAHFGRPPDDSTCCSHISPQHAAKVCTSPSWTWRWCCNWLFWSHSLWQRYISQVFCLFYIHIYKKGRCFPLPTLPRNQILDSTVKRHLASKGAIPHLWSDSCTDQTC